METKRVLWPPWICFVMGLCAAVPYAVFFASLAHLVPRAHPLVGLFSGVFLLFDGLLFGLLTVTFGWILLAGEREPSNATVIPSVLGMALGALGIIGNVVMFPYLFALQ